MRAVAGGDARTTAGEDAGATLGGRRHITNVVRGLIENAGGAGGDARTTAGEDAGATLGGPAPYH
jgi:hypothetical protein